MRRLSWLALALTVPLPALAVPAPAVQVDPGSHSLDALLDSAELWVLRKKPELARSVLQKVLAVQADEPRALLMLGELDLRASRPRAGLAQLARLQAVHPDSAELRQLQQLAQIHTGDRVRLQRLQELRENGQLAEAARLARQMFPTGEAPGLLGAEMAGLIASTPGGWEVSRRHVEARVARSGTALDRLALAEVLALAPGTRKQAWTRLRALIDEGVLPREVVASSWRRAIRLQPADVPAGPLWDDYRSALGEEQGRSSPTGNGRAAVAAALPPAKPAPDLPAQGAQTRQAGRTATLAKPDATATAPAREPGPSPDEVALADARREAGRLLDLEDADATARAADLLSVALEQHGDEPRAWGLYGIARLRQGQHAAAVAALERAQNGDPSANGGWLDLLLTARYWVGVGQARSAIEAGDDVAAISLLQALIETRPQATEGPLLLAGALGRQGDEAAARRLYDRVLAQSPDDPRAWRGLTALAMRSDPEEALAMLARRQGVATPADDDGGSDARPGAVAQAAAPDPADAVDGAAVRRIAAQRRAEGRHGAALRLLEQALVLAPADIWLRYDTARVYADFQVPAIARAVMDDGLASQAEEPDLLQAAGLIALATGDPVRAVEILDGLPPALADGPQRNLVQRARRERALVNARSALLAQDIPGTRSWLDEAEQLIDQRGTVVLASADGGSTRTDSVTDAEAATFEPWPELGIARMRLATHQVRSARDRLGLLPPTALATQVDALLEWARLNAEADQQETALDGLQKALDADPSGTGWTAAERAEVLLTHASLALDLDLPGTARVDADRLSTLLPDEATDARLRLLRLQRRMGNGRAARATLAGLLARSPDDPLVRIEAARQARQDADEAGALAHLDVARQRARPGSETALEVERVQDAIEADNQPVVEVAMHGGHNPGSPGRTELRSREATARLSWPQIGNGQFFVQVDRLSLDAGALPADRASATLLGRTLLSSPGGLGADAPQSSTGQALGFGWRGNRQQVDLGVVDLGLRNWLGGWRLDGSAGEDDGQFAWHVGLDRRLVTGSLLAWGGARDPVDGHAWGGVTLTALSGGFDLTLGEVHGLSGEARAGLLQGRGVAGNSTEQVRLAYTRLLAVSTTHRQTLGASVDIRTYRNNQNFHTDGLGGYYSPQVYHAVSVPWVHEGMDGRIAWQLRLAASHSVTIQKDAPYYPKDPQAQSTAGNPVHRGGGLADSLGGSARLLLEWRAAPTWAIGAGLSAERSRDYSPSQASIYLRHWMGRVAPPLGWPPEMLQPYVRR